MQLRLVVRRCVNRECDLYQRSRRPEQEGAFALPQGEFGLDVIALIGALRHAEHRSVPEIHRELSERGVAVSERTVTNLLDRYEELVALRLTDRIALRERLKEQGRAVLSIDGLQPDVGHEVLWVVRECLSGELLLARSLLGGTEKDLVPLLQEVADALPVPIAGVISDGQHAIRKAVGSALPGVPHQLCQFHYLREAAKGRSLRSRPPCQEGAQEKGAGGEAHRARARRAQRSRCRSRAWLLLGSQERDHRRWTTPTFGFGHKAPRASVSAIFETP